MRELGPVRFLLGSTPQEVAAALPYLAIARTQLGIMKSLNPDRLPVFSRQVTLLDGTVIACQSIFGQDTVSISPVVTPTEAAAAPTPSAEVALEEAPELPAAPQASNNNWLVAGYSVVGGFSQPTLWAPSGTILLPLGTHGGAPNTEGEARKIVPGDALSVAVIGWVNNDSYDETVWWTPGAAGSWDIHFTGLTWLPSGVQFFYSGSALAWDYAAVPPQPQLVSAPVLPARTATPHKARVAFQRRRTFTDLDTFTAYTVPALAAIEVDDGTGTIYTVGLWGADAVGTPALFGRSLVDWVAFAGANSPDVNSFTNVQIGEGGASIVYASIYGTYDLAASLVGTTYSFAEGSLALADLGGGDLVGSLNAGGYSSSSGSPVVARAQLPADFSDLTLREVSLDGKWFVAYETEGYVPLDKGVLNSWLAFGDSFRAARYQTAVQYLDQPPGVASPNASGAYIGSSGDAFASIFDNPSSQYTSVRWGPGLSIIRAASENAYVDGVSPDGSAVAGGSPSGQPWTWSASTGVTLLPIPADCISGEAAAVGDGARAAVGWVDSASDEWVVLWLDGTVVLRLEDSNLWFNDGAVLL